MVAENQFLRKQRALAARAGLDTSALLKPALPFTGGGSAVGQHPLAAALLTELYDAREPTHPAAPPPRSSPLGPLRRVKRGRRGRSRKRPEAPAATFESSHAGATSPKQFRQIRSPTSHSPFARTTRSNGATRTKSVGLPVLQHARSTPALPSQSQPAASRLKRRNKHRRGKHKPTEASGEPRAGRMPNINRMIDSEIRKSECAWGV